MSEENIVSPRVTIVTHGDLDGVVCGALWARRLLKAGLKRKEIEIIFAQPFQLPVPEDIKGEQVAVFDIAVNNRDPEMTMRFIEEIKDKLIAWIDHHKGWQKILAKLPDKLTEKFVIDEQAKAAAQIVFEVINGDFNCPEMRWTVKEAIVGDTREGELSQRGRLIDEAIKSNLRDDAIKEAALWWLTQGAPQDPENKEYRKLLEAQQKYREIKETTEQLINQYEIRHGIAVVDVTQENRDYDRTQLLIAGQKMAPTGISVVIGKNPEGEEIVTIATNREDINLVALFGLPSGAPFRISLPTAEWPLERVLEKLKNL